MAPEVLVKVFFSAKKSSSIAEDIGETHFGGFLRKKQPRTGEGAPDQVQ